MAVGPSTFATKMYPVAGFRLGTAVANIKKANRRDLVIMELVAGSTIAGTFTKNAFCAAPVKICQQNLASADQAGKSPFYLITNTGYANAGTGAKGLHDASSVCQGLAEYMGTSEKNVYPFSTGVIGEPLPVSRIVAGIPEACDALSESGWEDAAHGIMTTDTRPKGVSVQLTIDNKLVTITGISKGSGMIRPNMATMLAYIATDAAVEASLLQRLAQSATELSFNAITVDGDTSTNDCCMLAATACSGVVISESDAHSFALFTQALNQVYLQLAQAIVRDGEGATKFITVAVEQAATSDEAKSVAFTVAHSPLVKTALFASDPNWGRILAAVGRSGIDDLDVDGVSLHINDHLVAVNGALAPSYVESDITPEMQKDEITIRIALARGSATINVWTTDLSYDYVKINADYRS